MRGVWITVAVAALVPLAACAASTGPAGSVAAAVSTAPARPATRPPARPTPTPARLGRACQLLGDDAAGTLGVNATLVPTQNTAADCVYEASNGLDTIELTIESAAYEAGLVDAVLGYLDAGKAQKITGLGDAALRYSLDGLGTQVHVWAKGSYVVITLAIVSHPAASQDAALALARTVVSRL